jgi:hypothetical protein
MYRNNAPCAFIITEPIAAPFPYVTVMLVKLIDAQVVNQKMIPMSSNDRTLASRIQKTALNLFC